MKEKIVEYFHYFNHNREDYNEPDSSLESPKLEVSLFDDFEASHLTKPNLVDDISFPSLEQVITLCLYTLTLNLNLAHLEMSPRMS